MGGKGDPPWIVKEIKIWSLLKNNICTKKNLLLKKRKHKNSVTLSFKQITRSRPDLELINKKKKLVNLWILSFQLTIQWKWKKTKRWTNYLDYARELKILMSMAVLMMTIVVGSLGIVFKSLKKRLWGVKIWGRIKIIQITVPLRSAWILIMSYITITI